MFYHGRVLFKEAKELESVKDLMKTKIGQLKLKTEAKEKEKLEMERLYRVEKELKEEQTKKIIVLERRV